jgi:hypothetical protein
LLGGTYYGHPKAGTTAHPAAAELKQHGIGYYLAWHNHPAPTDPAFRLVGEFGHDTRRLSLYAVR